MTLEICEIRLREVLAGLDALGAGTSRSACYVAMALDHIGEARNALEARKAMSAMEKGHSQRI